MNKNQERKRLALV